MEQAVMEKRNKEYNAYVEKITPKVNVLYACLRAFVSGGIICTIGQMLNNVFVYFGSSKEDASLFTMLVLIFTSVILTGTNMYANLARWCGAGTLVPITGFANSIASAAIEFTPEGEVFGKGTRIFIIAGPVILYGIVSSFICGVIYYILTLV